MIDVPLACEDANSKLVEVVTVAHVDAENHVGNSLLQIRELTNKTSGQNIKQPPQKTKKNIFLLRGTRG